MTFPTPAGGKYRQIMVDLDPAKLLAKGLTPLDVVNAVNAQNLTLPAGTAKIGDKQYTIKTNSIPATIGDLNTIPLKFRQRRHGVDQGCRPGARRLCRAAEHRAQERPARGAADRDQERQRLDARCGEWRQGGACRGPRGGSAGLNINELFDQSTFVKASVDSVVREGAIAGALTALMILLFLGSWRSTLIVMISIPLAILSSLVTLYFLGHTLNTMTLGGLALAVGILVDDSTVTIENTHRLLTEEKMPLAQATLLRLGRHRRADAGLHARHLLRVHLGGVPRGPRQISVHAARPRRGVRHARVLRAVADADADHHRALAQGRAARRSARSRAAELVRALSCRAFERGFETMRQGYVDLLRLLLTRKAIVPIVAVVVLSLGGVMYFAVGRDFYPLIDGGQIQLHVRAPAGTRIETTEGILCRPSRTRSAR